ncbi:MULTISPECIES: hypothetical protein [Clostridium]|uniref:hypothetical protein n=1 Tax=Clostridium TaxID=1485 RepID=UPI000A9D4405|nr:MULTISPECIES: hypothetical protein [Clostridium]PJI09359.1 hypothetical protein CUB90_16385 [Clostridium sp. CT7]
MNVEEKRFLKNLCKMCFVKYQVVNSAPMISALISQVCRIKNLDVPLVEGVLYVKIRNRTLQYAHCFNTYHGNIIDASIYQFAIMNSGIKDIFPKIIVGDDIDEIEYSIFREIKYENQFKYKEEFLRSIIEEVDEYENSKLDKIDEYKDSKKQNLFYI